MDALAARLLLSSQEVQIKEMELYNMDVRNKRTFYSWI